VQILVTGGGGFLGSHVVEHLTDAGHQTFVPRSADYDLRTSVGVMRALTDGWPEVVVHLAAAVGGIGVNEAHPGKLLHDNAVMGLQLMDWSRQYGVRKFVTIGTACEYPEEAPLPLRESDIWNGYPTPVTAPYGIAKRLLLAQGQAYRDEYDFNAIHLIPTNLYGPGDDFDRQASHVIPALIRRFSEAAKEGRELVRCWGTGQATREFLYVEDCARAIVTATERYDSPEPMNIGTGIETSVAAVAQQIADIYGFKGRIGWDETRPDGVSRRRLDIGRAWSEMAFRASTHLEDGLKATVEWFEAQP
jgi:GDP-L-fucose synthase